MLVIVIIVAGIVWIALGMIIVAYFMWWKPYRTWTTSRLLRKAEKMTEKCKKEDRKSTTCEDVCAELKSRENCGLNNNESCVCYMPASCETLYDGDPDYLDHKEENCEGCDIVSDPGACSNRYLDRHINSANCGSHKEYTDTQCMAACESYDGFDKCNNAYCKQMLPTCQPCTITNTLGCTPEQINDVLNKCYTSGENKCETKSIDSACIDLESRNNISYKACANTTCLALTSDIVYSEMECTDSDIVANLPANCISESLPCLQLCQRIEGTDIVQDPGSGQITRSKACAQGGCSRFYNTIGWNCCTTSQFEHCSTSELENMSDDCVFKKIFGGHYMSKTTYRSQNA
jgi:hypothetical protein